MLATALRYTFEFYLDMKMHSVCFHWGLRLNWTNSNKCHADKEAHWRQSVPVKWQAWNITLFFCLWILTEVRPVLSEDHLVKLWYTASHSAHTDPLGGVYVSTDQSPWSFSELFLGAKCGMLSWMGAVGWLVAKLFFNTYIYMCVFMEKSRKKRVSLCFK